MGLLARARRACRAHERGEEHQVENQPIDERGREPQRLHEVDEQYDTGLVGVVPSFVLVCVIEDQDLSFLPMADRVIDLDCDC
jgi:hypothetical protein